MSLYFRALLANSFLPAGAALTYDDLVDTFDADLVSYWKFATGAGTDEAGTQNAVLTGSPETGVDTIVSQDTGGTCIAFAGAGLDYFEAAHNAAHKTASGTIAVTFQRDASPSKAILLACDSGGRGMSIEALASGAIRAFMRRTADNVAVILEGPSGDVAVGEAYTVIWKWGVGGLSLALWSAGGNLVRRLTNALEDGPTENTGPIRFGRWHSGTTGDPHDGPYARVVWLNRRIGDAEELSLGKPLTISRGSPPGDDFPTRVAALESVTLVWWARLAHGSQVIDEVSSPGNNGTLVNSSDLAFQVGDLITDSDGGSSMAFGGSIPPGGFSIAAPLQAVVFGAFFRIQCDAAWTTDRALFAAGDGDDENGEATGKIVSDGSGGLRVQFDSMGPAGVSKKAGGSVPVGQSIGVAFQRVAGDLKAYIGTTQGGWSEASLSYITGTAQTWGASPNLPWHVGYFPGGGGPTAGFNGLIADAMFWTGEISSADLDRLMGSIGQTVVAARGVTLPDIDEDAAPSTTSVATKVNPEDGVTLSIVTQATHGTAGVSGLSLTFDPNPVTGNQADSFTWRATHAAGTDDATADVTVLETAPTELAQPFRGYLYGADGQIGNGQTRLQQTGDEGVSFCWRCDYTGVITHFDIAERIGAGYSSPEGAGNHGIYTVEIRPADPNTLTAIPQTSPICRNPSWAATTVGAPGGNQTRVAFTTTGTVTAGQLYVILFRRNPGSEGLWTSINSGNRGSFWDDTPPYDNYAEPASGGGVGAINVDTGGIAPGAVSTSAAAKIAGWHPAFIDGVDYLLPFPIWHGSRKGRRNGTPQIQLHYADGTVGPFGQIGGEFGFNANIYPGGTPWGVRLNAAGQNPVQARIIFEVSRGTRTVDGLFVWAVRSTSDSGNFVVRLESGPTADTHAPDTNGSLIEEVSVNSSMLLLSGNNWVCNQLDSTTNELDLAHWIWIPLSTQRTLTDGSRYTVRFLTTGSVQVHMHGYAVADTRWGPNGRSLTWAQWMSTRRRSWHAWDDSRGGLEYSADGGETWAYMTAQMTGFMFRCVV